MNTWQIFRLLATIAFFWGAFQTPWASWGWAQFMLAGFGLHTAADFDVVGLIRKFIPQPAKKPRS